MIVLLYVYINSTNIPPIMIPDVFFYGENISFDDSLLICIYK